MSKALEQFSPEELQSLTDDLQAVLLKHNAEMGITSSINLMKVVETPDESSDTPAEEVQPETVNETA